MQRRRSIINVNEQAQGQNEQAQGQLSEIEKLSGIKIEKDWVVIVVKTQQGCFLANLALRTLETELLDIVKDIELLVNGLKAEELDQKLDSRYLSKLYRLVVMGVKIALFKSRAKAKRLTLKDYLDELLVNESIEEREKALEYYELANILTDRELVDLSIEKNANHQLQQILIEFGTNLDEIKENSEDLYIYKSKYRDRDISDYSVLFYYNVSDEPYTNKLYTDIK